MARPHKKGMEYFPFDTDFFEDDKIQLLEAKFGDKGIVIYQFLLCRIYSNSYYLHLDEDKVLLLAKHRNITPNQFYECLDYLLQKKFFNKDIYEKYSVLTSNSIQRRFLFMLQNRKDVQIILDFWLEDFAKYLKLNITDSEIEREKKLKELHKFDFYNYAQNSLNELVKLDLMQVISDLTPIKTDLMQQKKRKENEIKIKEKKENEKENEKERERESSENSQENAKLSLTHESDFISFLNFSLNEFQEYDKDLISELTENYFNKRKAIGFKQTNGIKIQNIESDLITWIKKDLKNVSNIKRDSKPNENDNKWSELDKLIRNRQDAI